MSYIEIVLLVFGVIWAVFGLLLVHFLIFTLIGIFTRKKYPHAEEKLRYGVIISARNEEKVIGNLIETLRRSDYPQDKLDIFVVAHNCTDRTAEIARSKGAKVWEYDNPAEKTLGYAYRYLYNRIREEYGTEDYDAFLVMNADNVVPPEYLGRMNDAFVANGKKQVICSYRNSSNFGSNYMSCLYGIFFLAAGRYEMRGRTVCGCSTRVSGTGYLFPAEIVKEGWEYVTLTEDWEFTADQIARGRKIFYCDEAEFFDEQPTTVRIMLRQRMRWACGHMTVFFTRFKALMKVIFTPKRKGEEKRNRGSAYDISVCIMPLGVISVFNLLVQLVLVALAPLFGCGAAESWALFGVIAGASCAFGYLAMAFSAVLLLILERKRIRYVGWGKRISAVLLWPFFLSIAVFMDVGALFVKNLEWKPIPHTGARKELLKGGN